MAVTLSAIFKDSASEWMNWDSQYALSLVESDSIEIGRRADLYARAPIREMQKRGWIKLTSDPSELESELAEFFAAPVSGVHAKIWPLQILTPIQSAWCHRARQLASALVVQAFDPHQFSNLEKELRVLAAYPKECQASSKSLRKVRHPLCRS